MKKIVLGGSVLLLLFGASALLVPALVPQDVYKSVISERVKKATGRDFRMRGDVRLSLFPRIRAEVRDAALANLAGARRPEMARVSRIVFDIAVLPLLRGKVAINSFSLEKPRIHLEVDRSGRKNWRFRPRRRGRKNADALPPRARNAPARGGGGRAGLFELPLEILLLGNARLRDGIVTYRNAKRGIQTRIDKVNLRLSASEADGPLSAEGTFVWNGAPVRLTLSVGSARRIAAGKPAAVSLRADSGRFGIELRSRDFVVHPFRFTGSLDLRAPSLRLLAAWGGRRRNRKGTGPGRLRIRGNVSATDKRVSLSGARIRLDNMNAEGKVDVAFGRRPPFVKGTLKLDRLDLNPYLPSERRKSAVRPVPAPAGRPRLFRVRAGAPSTIAARKTASPWGRAPFDLKMLRKLDAELDLRSDRIRYRRIRTGPAELHLRLRNGVLTADLRKFSLYGGSGSGSLTIDGAARPPALRQEWRFDGVQAQPFLRDAAGLGWLSGTARARLRIAGKGNTPHELVRSLAGEGAAKLTDGTVRGASLGAVERILPGMSLSLKNMKTDFSELSGSFSLRRGILRTDDLLLEGPLLRLTGRGTADLPRRRLHFRFGPRDALPLKIRGGLPKFTGIPVIIRGPWEGPEYCSDLRSLLKSESRKRRIRESCGGSFEEMMKGLLRTGALKRASKYLWRERRRELGKMAEEALGGLSGSRGRKRKKRGKRRERLKETLRELRKLFR